MTFRSVYASGTSITSGSGYGVAASGDTVAISTSSRSQTIDAATCSPPERNGLGRYVAPLVPLAILGSMEWFVISKGGPVFGGKWDDLGWLPYAIILLVAYVIYKFPAIYVQRNIVYPELMREWEDSLLCMNCKKKSYGNSRTQFQWKAGVEDWAWSKQSFVFALIALFFIITHAFILTIVLSSGVAFVLHKLKTMSSSRSESPPSFQMIGGQKRPVPTVPKTCKADTADARDERQIHGSNRAGWENLKHFDVGPLREEISACTDEQLKVGLEADLIRWEHLNRWRQHILDVFDGKVNLFDLEALMTIDGQRASDAIPTKFKDLTLQLHYGNRMSASDFLLFNQYVARMKVLHEDYLRLVPIA